MIDKRILMEHDAWQPLLGILSKGFSNMASDWLAAVLPVNQMPGLKIFWISIIAIGTAGITQDTHNANFSTLSILLNAPADKLYRGRLCIHCTKPKVYKSMLTYKTWCVFMILLVLLCNECLNPLITERTLQPWRGRNNVTFASIVIYKFDNLIDVYIN